MHHLSSEAAIDYHSGAPEFTRKLLLALCCLIVNSKSFCILSILRFKVSDYPLVSSNLSHIMSCFITRLFYITPPDAMFNYMLKSLAQSINSLILETVADTWISG